MNLKSFIAEFRNKKGSAILFAALVEKIGGFLLILIVLNFIPKKEYGLIVYANTSLDFIIPFIGFGIHQGLIRFGSLSKSQINKKNLFLITFKKGLKYSLLLVGGIVLLSPLITYNSKNSLPYLLILSFQLISLFLFEILRIYVRLINLNKLYAKITIIKTVVLVTFTAIITLNLSGIGYVLSLTLTPLFIAFFFIYKLRLLKGYNNTNINFNLKEFLIYGMFTSFAGVLSQLLYAVDIILITNILQQEELTAQYKASTVLPFSFLFLSVAFIRTNFVKLANKSVNDKTYIKQYYINYLKIFSVLSVLIVAFFYFFSDSIFFIFGKQYTNEYNLMFIFSVGVAGALLLRIPLGNILSAIGWSKITALNSLIVLIFNLILSYFLINKIGLIGAAIATSFMFWFSGILSLIAFIIFLKR